jgi:hypothetical protein
VQQGGTADVSRKEGVLPCNYHLLLSDEGGGNRKEDKKASHHWWGQRDNE